MAIDNYKEYKVNDDGGIESQEKYQLIVQGLIAHFVFGTGLFIGYTLVY